MLDVEILKSKFNGKFKFENSYLKMLDVKDEIYQIETLIGHILIQ